MSISSKGYLSFNSRNRTVSTRPCYARYQGFDLDFVNVNGVGVSKCKLQASSNINITQYNNKIFWEDAGMSYDAEVPPGAYTYATFATALQNAMVIAQLGVVVTELSGVFTITTPVPTKFVRPIRPNGEPFVNDGKLITDMLYIELETPLNAIHIGLKVAELYYSSYIDLVSSDIHQGMTLSDTDTNKGTSNILHRVYFSDPETVEGRSVIEDIYNIKWINSQIPNNSNIEIRALDEFGNMYYDPEDLLSYSLLMMLT